MGEMHTNITARKLCEMTSTKEDTLRMRFAKLHESNPALFPDKWRIDGELNPKQVAALIQAGERKGSAPKEKEYAASVPSTDEPMILEQGRPIVVAPQKVEVRRWPLWAALIVTAGASVPNMVEVTTAIKGSSLVAWALTAVFTVVPGLLIAARLRGFLWFFVVIGVMGYTAFCNATSIFGGLTALDKGYILQPTVFLEAVTNLLNTDYLNTARTIAYFMALSLGAIEYLAFKNLAK